MKDQLFLSSAPVVIIHTCRYWLCHLGVRFFCTFLGRGSGWLSGFLPCLSFLWTPVRVPPQTGALHVDWVFSPYLIAWVFPIGVFFPSKTEHFFLFPIHLVVVGAYCAVGCVIKWIKAVLISGQTCMANEHRILTIEIWLPLCPVGTKQRVDACDVSARGVK